MKTIIEPGKMYSLFGKSGMMEEIKPVGPLPQYSRVYSFGAGMSEAVYAVVDDQNNLVKMSKNYEGDYFGPFHHFDKYSKAISQKFGIGFYWDDVEPDFRFNPEAVQMAIIDGLKNGTIEREHSYSLTYAKKELNDAQKKFEIAKKLWA
jgi:hypothetical protein